MKGDVKVNEYLNQILSIELTSINQYFLHARMFKNWGFSELDEKAYKKSIKDMKQADKLIERILFLEGLPNLQKLNRLRIGENTAEMLQCDLDQIVEQLEVLKEAIAYCESVKDYVSRELLEEIQEYEEEYLDWLETQQSLIAQVGIENYQQSMM
ncbi:MULTISPECIES: bacterioferritin [Oceanospirillaceae]|jgi:bacterioferritin|uniref:bacterioferritin n=1 Tax=Oceanospirillaceae TaxID=135620 RepID=UPI0011939CEF|nr:MULTISPECIES: bacterioferritin [Thalassolituus]MBU2038674.1 bacterioferritin [Gammaproteobacteria bacterium]MCB2385104.1 bacterioferritin [Thalassolituus alkanivorans]MCB2423385.1 bacterioferritin [Thalassolituus alkanivorans]TVV42063.1 bacterioferritin [Thalassolituus sp. C2-1]